MSIIRISKDDNFTIISNHPLKDNKLSMRAKGLLCYMLSLPDDWTFYETELPKHFNNCRSAIRTAIKELMEHGYIVRDKIPLQKGKFTGYNYTVYEKPTRINRRGKTDAVKRTLLSTDKPSTNRVSTNKQDIISLLPESVSLDLKRSWIDWVKYRIEIKKRLTASTAKRQVKQLQKWGDDIAVKSIEQSITSGWTGLFEVKVGKMDFNKIINKYER